MNTTPPTDPHTGLSPRQPLTPHVAIDPALRLLWRASAHLRFVLRDSIYDFDAGDKIAKEDPTAALITDIDKHLATAKPCQWQTKLPR